MLNPLLRPALSFKATSTRSETVQAFSSGGSAAPLGIRDLDERTRPLDPLEEAALPTSMQNYLWVQSSNSAPGQAPLPLTRAWCQLDNHQLAVSVPCQPKFVIDLLLCTVKQARDLNVQFAFHVISPTMQLTFQALSNESMMLWMDCIQRGILHQLKTQRRASASNANEESTLEELWAVPGNEFCADCGAPRPDWTSRNLGIMICQDCSGIHRSLGTHISKVRSLRLDRLDDSLLQVMVIVMCPGNNRR